MGRRQFGRIRRLASGRWQARYPGPDGVDRSLGTYDTKLTAHRALVSLEQTITRGDWVSPALRDQTLAEYARAWLASRQLRLRTRESYEDQLRLRILPRLGALPLSKITPRHVREWYGALVQQADTAGRGHRAATSSYRVLRAMLNTAVQDEILLRNPCALRGASAERPTIDPWSTSTTSGPWPTPFPTSTAQLSGWPRGPRCGPPSWPACAEPTSTCQTGR